MKKLGIVLAGTVLLAACGQETAELKSDDQKASYALGFRSAEQMRSLENLDLDAMVAGLRDGFAEDGKSQLGDEDLDQLIRDFQGRKPAKNSWPRMPSVKALPSPTAACSTKCWSPVKKVVHPRHWKTPWKFTTTAPCRTAPSLTAP